MDASAIMQNDATLENLKAMTDATLEYGAYRSPSSPAPAAPPPPATPGLPAWVTGAKPRPGICFPWAEKALSLPPIAGDSALIERIWEENEALAYIYIWHLVLSF
jgi:hypothetical protein